MDQLFFSALFVTAATIRAWTFLAGLPFLRANIRLFSLFLIALSLGGSVWITQKTGGPAGSEAAAKNWFLIGFGFGAEAVVGYLLSIPFAFATHQTAITLRLTDLLRGAQEAEQAIPGLAERGSVLERAAWLVAAAVIFVSGSYRQVIGVWYASFNLMPPLFACVIGGRSEMETISEMKTFSMQLGPMLAGCAAIGLQAVLASIVFLMPLLAAALAIDLARLIIGRLAGERNLAAEMQGIKLIVVLLLGAVLIGTFGGENLERGISAAAKIDRSFVSAR